MPVLAALSYPLCIKPEGPSDLSLGGAEMPSEERVMDRMTERMSREERVEMMV